VPTGVAIPDARDQLFEAAERVLVRDGPSALTSRAITTEAGVAKGVLHRHFADLDAFLAELVLDRVSRIDQQGADLRDCAGTATVVDNLTGWMKDLFGSVAVAIVALVISRDELRAELRQSMPTGMPILTQAAAMIASYLSIERDLGRIAADAEIEMLAPMLIGTLHLLFAGSKGNPPDVRKVRKVVGAVIAGVVREPLP
jgi:AcrR family transcriptional regulator